VRLRLLVIAVHPTPAAAETRRRTCTGRPPGRTRDREHAWIGRMAVLLRRPGHAHRGV